MTQQTEFSKDPRTAQQIAEHYTLEKKLAERLLHSSRAERGRLYHSLYEELFRGIIHHGQIRRKAAASERLNQVSSDSQLIHSFLPPGGNYLELGAGDCMLAKEVARFAGHVYAIEVSETISAQHDFPDNLELIITDGVSIAVPEKSVNVAFSDQLMEHLHPQDALPQLKNIHRALVDGGVYICATPNRLSGPHDISKHFDDVAKGFHLKEYTISELNRLFVEAGFRRTYVLRKIGQRWRRLAKTPLCALEALVTPLPKWARLRLAEAVRPRILISFTLVGVK